MPNTTKAKAIRLFMDMYNFELNNISSQQRMLANTQSNFVSYIKMDEIDKSIDKIDLTSKEVLFQTQHDYFYFRNAIETIYPNSKINITDKFINYMEISSTWNDYLDATYKLNKV